LSPHEKRLRRTIGEGLESRRADETPVSVREPTGRSRRSLSKDPGLALIALGLRSADLRQPGSARALSDPVVSRTWETGDMTDHALPETEPVREEAGLHLHWQGRRSYKSLIPVPRVLERDDDLSFQADRGNNLVIEGLRALNRSRVSVLDSADLDIEIDRPGPGELEDAPAAHALRVGPRRRDRARNLERNRFLIADILNRVEVLEADDDFHDRREVSVKSPAPGVETDSAALADGEEPR